MLKFNLIFWRGGGGDSLSTLVQPIFMLLIAHSLSQNIDISKVCISH